MEYTIAEFAALKSTTPENIRVMIHRNKIPAGYRYDYERRVILSLAQDAIEYVHPSKLTAEQKLNLNNAHVDFAGNVKKISEATGIHYTTVYRFFKQQFKDKDQSRTDKGTSRKIPSDHIGYVRKCFDNWYCRNAQKNVKLAIYQVEKELGHKVPRRLADKWAAALTGAHTLKHYYKDFISTYTYHHKRDLWTEYPNFMDCVVSDVWKIDDPYVNEQDKIKIDAELELLKTKSINQWERARTKSSTAYALVFMDVKTRYPVEVAICPHSVCGADVKKAMLSVIVNWGDPKVWLLDNGHEFINDATMDFLYGIYMGSIGEWIQDKREKKVILKEEGLLINSRAHHPQSKGMIEAAFKIMKTQWASYSISYSPNQFESRKPGAALSSVQPVQSFEDLAVSLRQFIYGDFVKAERKMFLNPGLAESHPENKSRPKTIEEAFNIAYSNYDKKDVDQYLLAYHYADRRKNVTFRNGELTFVDANSKLKFHYVPTDFESMSEYHLQKLTVLMDPKDISHCWIYKEDKLLSEGFDLALSGKLGLTKERASTLGKLQRNIESIERKKLNKIDEYNAFKESITVKDENGNEETVDTNTGEVLSDCHAELVSASESVSGSASSENNNSEETIYENEEPLDDLDADDLTII